MRPFWFDEYLGKRAVPGRPCWQGQEIKPRPKVFLTYTEQFTFETLDELKSKYATICMVWR